MRVKDVMTPGVACCLPDSSLQSVAGLMVEHDCGAIPVVENEESMRPVGVVTDRDITTRAVAQGKNPLTMTAREVMTGDCHTVSADSSLEDCCAAMESHQVRRVVVTDSSGACRGIVSQAGVAHHASLGQTGQVVHEVSQPAGAF